VVLAHFGSDLGAHAEFGRRLRSNPSGCHDFGHMSKIDLCEQCGQRKKNAGISYAVNLNDRQVMIGKVAGLSPSCQAAQTASADGEFQAADFLRGMRSIDV
jgi:hypothetical protein